ncbi:hypothetical protein Taro_030001 [Colocasia esculenta]|uniref:Retrotransposon gag domain-containing protein n=1 Tax=Colocasia esculenta TaxID=4460 RepID=A0A843VF78_COLES|nr:hypothetical protein [Colocasia esculenta]
MKDYDAILGLDWLEEHYGLVDCRGKKITFRIPGEDEFSHPLPRNLAGRFVISAMKAIKMIRQFGASSGDLQRLEASLDIGGGFPDLKLEATTPQKTERRPELDGKIPCRQALRLAANDFVGEQRCEEQAEQQAPSPHGPVLPPPPPVDYEAHTQGALQAQLEAQERADVWWASLLHTRFEDEAIDVAWDEFMRLFRAMFVPEHIQDRMEQEFLSLTQGSMTMLEYEARFAELSNLIS